MIAIIFEIWPEEEHRNAYLDMAAGLKTLLETIDGFISIERFSSLSEPGKILSLSFWRDEELSPPGATWSRTVMRRFRGEAGFSRITGCA
jgi:heme-degrading monooxygenase HmoA